VREATRELERQADLVEDLGDLRLALARRADAMHIERCPQNRADALTWIER